MNRLYFWIIQITVISMFAINGQDNTPIKYDELIPISSMVENRTTSDLEQHSNITVKETIVEQPKVIYRKSPSTTSNGYSWLFHKSQTGTPAIKKVSYEEIFDNYGQLLEIKMIEGSEEIIPSTPTVYEPGSPMKVGAYFNARISRYGVDCVGCSGQYTGYGRNALGIEMSSELGVKQANGTWKEGVTWEGYYIVAADKSIPFCTILEIENHGYSGEGLVPGQTFKAIVMDRGSAITSNRLDLYIGSEDDINQNIKLNTSIHHPKATIIRLGGMTKDSSGKKTCMK